MTELLTFLAGIVAGILLLMGLASAVFALSNILRNRTGDPIYDALVSARCILIGTGVTVPEFAPTMEAAREAILAAAAECDRMEQSYLWWEAALPSGVMKPNYDTARAMEAAPALMRLAKSL